MDKIQKITFDLIVWHVCNAYGLDPRLVFIKSIRREVCFPRQIIQYLSKKYLKLSYQEIALKTGLKHHGSVLNSIKTINNLKDTDVYFRQRLEFIDHNLNIPTMT